MEHTHIAAITSPTMPSTGIRVTLWIAQFLLAGLFIMSGFMKLATPIPELAKMMPWVGEYSAWFVRSIGLIDLAGGIGILLQALIPIQPRLTVLAAMGYGTAILCHRLSHLAR